MILQFFCILCAAWILAMIIWIVIGGILAIRLVVFGKYLSGKTRAWFERIGNVLFFDRQPIE